MISLAGLAAGAVASFVALSNTSATYSAEQTQSAFKQHGLGLNRVGGPIDGTTYLTPTDGAFTVLVVRSDSLAEKWFEPYARDEDLNTVELRAANLIVLADHSNSDVPLAAATRSKIRAAVASLGNGTR